MSADSAVAQTPGIALPEWKPSFSPWLIAASVMLATFMEVLDTSVANVALPHIAGTLSATTDESTWVLTSYLISNAIILPATGWLSNVFGRKRFLIFCIIMFTIASGLCGIAGSLGFLVLARIIQGAGGGALQPISQAILLESFPKEKRGEAMAIFAMGVIVAPIIGPTMGGWITDNYSWRWVFYINLPVGILAIIMSNLFVEDPPYIKRSKSGKVDYIGFGFMAIWLATLQIILDKGQESDWFSAVWVRWFTFISVACFFLFIIRELRTDEPIVNLRIFKVRNFAIGTFMITIIGVVLYSSTVMIPLYLQQLMGYTAFLSGLALSPRGLAALATTVLVGRLVGIIDNRFLIIVGFGIIALSSFMLSHINLQMGMWNAIWPSVVNGLGISFIFVPLTTLTMGTLHNEQMGNASGIFNLMRNIGGGIGISSVTTMLSRGAQAHQALLISHLTPYDPVYQQQYHALYSHFHTQTGAFASNQLALGAIYQNLVGQATLLAYVDDFRILGILSLLCIPLAFLFQKVKLAKTKAPMH